MNEVGSRRIERINEQLREEISDLIRRELKDPRLAGIVSITDVKTVPDLSLARVFISVLGDEEQAQASLKTLDHAAGFLRRRLTGRLRLRRVPEIMFRLDTSIERGDRILGLLREIEVQDSGNTELDEGPKLDNAEERG
jgi:ribosome-binding factor A